MTNKTYMLFIGRTYYPGAGLEDFKGSFASIDEAQSYVNKHIEEDDWYHIYDGLLLVREGRMDYGDEAPYWETPK